jgi:UDP-glucose 4-epimerase
LINVLKCADEFGVEYFVFSSSCTVYGNPDQIPVLETTPQKPAASPYGATKQMGEQIVEEAIKTTVTKAILLRYFNPVGAHPSNLIGEMPLGKPANLFPAITQTAIGKLPMMQVWGDDYPTKDGSCIRDYIHVSDIAHAHTLALEYLINSAAAEKCSIFNLGSGNGYTVLEVIAAFEKISGMSLNYQLGPRRSGDVIAIYANSEKARKELGWEPQLGLDDMIRTAWEWEKAIQ